MTEGNELKLLLKFAVPMLVGNIFQQFYNIVDSIIVGKFVGAKELGAVGAVGSVVYLLYALCLGLGVGIGVLVSQYFGAGDDDYVKKIIVNSIYITAAAGTVISIVGIVFAEPILLMMNTPEESFKAALAYMRIVCGTTIVVAGYNTISSILRALGDSKTPLIFVIIACGVNVVLDLIFVVVFRRGVQGAAWATVIAQFISLVGAVLLGMRRNPYLKLKRGHLKADIRVLSRCLRLGFPIALQEAMVASSCLVLQRAVNGFGPVVMAAYAATGRVEGIIGPPLSALGAAASTFAGQNVGAGRYDRVKTGCIKSASIVVAFSVLLITVMFLFGESIIHIFVNEPDVIAIGAKGLRISSMMYVGLGMIYIMRGTLNGVGDAGFAIINGLVELVGRLVFTGLLIRIPGIGMWGIWYTNGLNWMLTGIISIIRFVRGRWKTKAVTEQ